jgi:predicted GTPase
VIGSTGAGKSSTLNTLCGLQGKFLVSASEQSETSKTATELVLWRGSETMEVELIDTPGIADTKGRDTKHIAEMVAKIKEKKKVNAFLIVLNGQNTRFD